MCIRDRAIMPPIEFFLLKFIYFVLRYIIYYSKVGAVLISEGDFIAEAYYFAAYSYE